MTHNRINKFLRFTAFFTCLFFTVNTLAWGAGPLDLKPSAAFDGARPLALSLPDDLGFVREQSPAHAAPSPEHPLIIHIQDAHCNYSAQKNTAEILKILKKQYGIKHVFVEGAAGQLDARYLQFSENKALNRKAAEILAKMGEMTGSDLYLFDHPDGLIFTGIENPLFYRQEIQELKKALHEEKASREWIRSERVGLEREISRLGNKGLLAALRMSLDLENEKTSFLKIIASLDDLSRRHLGRDLRRAGEQREFPNLMRLVRLRDLEGEVSAEKAKAEVRGIKNEKLSGFFDSSASPRETLEEIYSSLKSSGFDFDKYPQFSRYAKQRIFESELDGAGLFDEINRLLNLLIANLAKTEGEKKSAENVKNFKLTSKLLLLELTRDEWQSLSSKRRENPAFRFYQLAERRETEFLKIIRETIKKEKLDRAVVITGGFHTDAIKKSFEKNNSHYSVISPRLSGDSRTNYAKTMLGRAAKDIETSEASPVPQSVEPATASSLGVNVVLRNEIRKAAASSLGQMEMFGDKKQAPAFQKILPGDWPIPQGKININTASVAQLVKAGLKEKTAKRVVEKRAAKPFTAYQELLEVNGIGESTLAKLKSKIVLNAAEERGTAPGSVHIVLAPHAAPGDIELFSAASRKFSESARHPIYLMENAAVNQDVIDQLAPPGIYPLNVLLTQERMLPLLRKYYDQIVKHVKDQSEKTNDEAYRRAEAQTGSDEYKKSVFKLLYELGMPSMFEYTDFESWLAALKVVGYPDLARKYFEIGELGEADKLKSEQEIANRTNIFFTNPQARRDHNIAFQIAELALQGWDVEAPLGAHHIGTARIVQELAAQMGFTVTVDSFFDAGRLTPLTEATYRAANGEAFDDETRKKMLRLDIIYEYLLLDIFNQWESTDKREKRPRPILSLWSGEDIEQLSQEYKKLIPAQKRKNVFLRVLLRVLAKNILKFSGKSEEISAKASIADLQNFADHLAALNPEISQAALLDSVKNWIEQKFPQYKASGKSDRLGQNLLFDAAETPLPHDFEDKLGPKHRGDSNASSLGSFEKRRLEDGEIHWREALRSPDLFADSHVIHARERYDSTFEGRLPGFGLAPAIFFEHLRGFYRDRFKEMIAELEKTKAFGAGKIRILPNLHHKIRPFAYDRKEAVPEEELKLFRERMKAAVAETRPFVTHAEGVNINSYAAELYIQLIPSEEYAGLYEKLFNKERPGVLYPANFAAVIKDLNEEEYSDLISFMERWRYADFGEIAADQIHLVHHSDHEWTNKLSNEPYLFEKNPEVTRLTTVGFANIKQSKLLHLLRQYQTDVVIDVREVAFHSKERGAFTSENLEEALKRNKIKYVHVPELGAPKNIRNQFNVDRRIDKFRAAYLQHLEPRRELLKRVVKFLSGKKAVLLSFPEDPEEDHRAILLEEMLRLCDVIEPPRDLNFTQQPVVPLASKKKQKRPDAPGQMDLFGDNPPSQGQSLGDAGSLDAEALLNRVEDAVGNIEVFMFREDGLQKVVHKIFGKKDLKTTKAINGLVSAFRHGLVRPTLAVFASCEAMVKSKKLGAQINPENVKKEFDAVKADLKKFVAFNEKREFRIQKTIVTFQAAMVNLLAESGVDAGQFDAEYKERIKEAAEKIHEQILQHLEVIEDALNKLTRPPANSKPAAEASSLGERESAGEDLIDLIRGGAKNWEYDEELIRSIGNVLGREFFFEDFLDSFRDLQQEIAITENPGLMLWLAAAHLFEMEEALKKFLESAKKEKDEEKYEEEIDFAEEMMNYVNRVLRLRNKMVTHSSPKNRVWTPESNQPVSWSKKTEVKPGVPDTDWEMMHFYKLVEKDSGGKRSRVFLPSKNQYRFENNFTQARIIFGDSDFSHDELTVQSLFPGYRFVNAPSMDPFGNLRLLALSESDNSDLHIYTVETGKQPGTYKIELKINPQEQSLFYLTVNQDVSVWYNADKTPVTRFETKTYLESEWTRENSVRAHVLPAGLENYRLEADGRLRLVFSKHDFLFDEYLGAVTTNKTEEKSGGASLGRYLQAALLAGALSLAACASTSGPRQFYSVTSGGLKIALLTDPGEQTGEYPVALPAGERVLVDYNQSMLSAFFTRRTFAPRRTVVLTQTDNSAAEHPSTWIQLSEPMNLGPSEYMVVKFRNPSEQPGGRWKIEVWNQNNSRFDTRLAEAEFNTDGATAWTTVQVPILSKEFPATHVNIQWLGGGVPVLELRAVTLSQNPLGNQVARANSLGESGEALKPLPHELERIVVRHLTPIPEEPETAEATSKVFQEPLFTEKEIWQLTLEIEKTSSVFEPVRLIKQESRILRAFWEKFSEKPAAADPAVKERRSALAEMYQSFVNSRLIHINELMRLSKELEEGIAMRNFVELAAALARRGKIKQALAVIEEGNRYYPGSRLLTMLKRTFEDNSAPAWKKKLKTGFVRFLAIFVRPSWFEEQENKIRYVFGDIIDFWWKNEGMIRKLLPMLSESINPYLYKNFIPHIKAAEYARPVIFGSMVLAGRILNQILQLSDEISYFASGDPKKYKQEKELAELLKNKANVAQKTLAEIEDFTSAKTGWIKRGDFSVRFESRAMTRAGFRAARVRFQGKDEKEVKEKLITLDVHDQFSGDVLSPPDQLGLATFSKKIYWVSRSRSSGRIQVEKDYPDEFHQDFSRLEGMSLGKDEKEKFVVLREGLPFTGWVKLPKRVLRFEKHLIDFDPEYKTSESSWLIQQTADGNIAVMNPKKQEMRARFSLPENALLLSKALSADGNFAAFVFRPVPGKHAVVRICDVENQKLLNEFAVEDAFPGMCIALSRDASQLAVEAEKHGNAKLVYIYETQAELLWRWLAPEKNLTTLHFTSDGRFLYTRHGEGSGRSISVFDMADMSDFGDFGTDARRRAWNANIKAMMFDEQKWKTDGDQFITVLRKHLQNVVHEQKKEALILSAGLFLLGLLFGLPWAAAFLMPSAVILIVAAGVSVSKFFNFEKIIAEIRFSKKIRQFTSPDYVNQIFAARARWLATQDLGAAPRASLTPDGQRAVRAIAEFFVAKHKDLNQRIDAFMHHFKNIAASDQQIYAMNELTGAVLKLKRENERDVARELMRRIQADTEIDDEVRRAAGMRYQELGISSAPESPEKPSSTLPKNDKKRASEGSSLGEIIKPGRIVRPYVAGPFADITGQLADMLISRKTDNETQRQIWQWICIVSQRIEALIGNTEILRNLRGKVGAVFYVLQSERAVLSNDDWRNVFDYMEGLQNELIRFSLHQKSTEIHKKRNARPAAGKMETLNLILPKKTGLITGRDSFAADYDNENLIIEAEDIPVWAATLDSKSPFAAEIQAGNLILRSKLNNKMPVRKIALVIVEHLEIPAAQNYIAIALKNFGLREDVEFWYPEPFGFQVPHKNFSKRLGNFEVQVLRDPKKLVYPILQFVLPGGAKVIGFLQPHSNTHVALVTDPLFGNQPPRPDYLLQFTDQGTLVGGIAIREIRTEFLYPRPILRKTEDNWVSYQIGNFIVVPVGFPSFSTHPDKNKVPFFVQIKDATYGKVLLEMDEAKLRTVRKFYLALNGKKYPDPSRLYAEIVDPAQPHLRQHQPIAVNAASLGARRKISADALYREFMEGLGLNPEELSKEETRDSKLFVRNLKRKPDGVARVVRLADYAVKPSDIPAMGTLFDRIAGIGTAWASEDSQVKFSAKQVFADLTKQKVQESDSPLDFVITEEIARDAGAAEEIVEVASLWKQSKIVLLWNMENPSAFIKRPSHLERLKRLALKRKLYIEDRPLLEASISEKLSRDLRPGVSAVSFEAMKDRYSIPELDDHLTRVRMDEEALMKSKLNRKDVMELIARLSRIKDAKEREGLLRFAGLREENGFFVAGTEFFNFLAQNYAAHQSIARAA